MPTLTDLAKYFEDECNLVGETDTAIAATIGTFAANQNVILYGPSSGGKTKLAESVLSLSVERDIPPDKLFNDPDLLLEIGGIYRYEFGSDTDIAYSEQELKKANLLFVPELQKVAKQDLMLEVLKTLGEGRVAYRNVVRDGGKSRERQKMDHAPIFSTIATENEFDLQDEMELNNRMLMLYIDDSAKQTQNIMTAKAESRFGTKNISTEKDIGNIKRHVNLLWEKSDLQIQNPFAVDIAQDYLPEKYVLSRRFIDYYLDVMDGITRWYAVDSSRVASKVDKQFTGYLTSLEDVYLTERLIGSEIRGSMLKLPPQSQHIFKIFQSVEDPDDNEMEDLQAAWYHDKHGRVMLPSNIILQQMGDMGITMNLPNLENILDSMSQFGYLLRESGRNNRYGLVSVANPNMGGVDYSSILKKAKSKVQREFPNQYDMWLKQQSLKVTDPLTDEEIDLAQTSSKKVKAQKKKVVKDQPTGIEKFL